MKALKEDLTYILKKKKDHLSVRQLYVLLSCSEEDQTVRGLAKMMDVSKPAVTRAADKLEDEKLLIRKPDKSDGRSVILSATKAGKTFVSGIPD